mgnify:CR=1 FL=1
MPKNEEVSLASLGINLPYNMQAEQSVLGAALVDETVLYRLITDMEPEMFYSDQNRAIYETMRSLYTESEAVDIVTLVNALASNKTFASADDAKVYLARIAETLPSVSNVDSYFKIVKEKYQGRRLIDAARSILNETASGEDADLLLESAEQKIYDIRSGRDKSGVKTIRESILEVIDTMTCEQLTDRILSSTANIDSQAFRTGRLNNSDWNDFAQATSLLYNAPIYMDDSSGISVPEIKAKIRTINQDPKKEKIGLVIIDYLQLMQSAKRTESRVQEISDITRNLKIMAKELNVPVIALSQLSRAAEKTTGRSDHRPQLSDLRDSGSIEQDADIVLFLYRAAYYNAQNGEENQANENEAECIVAKNRHGETSVVRLGWDGAHTRFSNLDVTHEF